jgi:hypothetical protein
MTTLFRYLIFGALAQAPSGHDPSLFTYRALAHPVETSCASDASALADRIHSLAGVTIYGAYCDRAGTRDEDLRVVYVALAALPVESTIDDLAIDGQGMYATLAACQTDLPGQVAHFSSATGLVALVSYCFLDEEFLAQRPYALRIEGLGAAAQHAIAQTLVIDQPALDFDASARAFLAAARARSLDLAQAAFDTSATGVARLTFVYYGTARLPFVVSNVLEYDDVATCVAQTAALGGLTGPLPHPPIYNLCVHDDESESASFAVATLYVGSPDRLPFAQSIAPDRFATFAACQAARAQVTAHLEQALGRQAAGALCDGAGGEYAVHVLWDPTQ